MEFTVVRGDIADQEVDAVVNASGTSLRMGSGVGGSLKRKGGRELNEEASAKGPVELGEAVVTDGYDLDADHVVHAAAVPHFGDEEVTAESIRLATRNSLATVDELGCRSVALPAIGCGIAGFDLAEGARIIADEIRAFEPESLADVRFVTYSEEERRTVSNSIGR